MHPHSSGCASSTSFACTTPTAVGLCSTVQCMAVAWWSCSCIIRGHCGLSPLDASFSWIPVLGRTRRRTYTQQDAPINVHVHTPAHALAYHIFTLLSHLPPTHPAADFSVGGDVYMAHAPACEGQRASVEEVEAHASAVAKGMTVSANAALTFVDFVDNVEAAKLRGTSKLFRGVPRAVPRCLASIREGMLGGGGASRGPRACRRGRDRGWPDRVQGRPRRHRQ
jgi:hypothetical protein